MILLWTNGSWPLLDEAKTEKERRTEFEDNLKAVYHGVRIKVLRCRKIGPQRYRVRVRAGAKAAERIVEDLDGVRVRGRRDGT